jgi:glycosyltransferase involved in cell wall biosynthesis
VARIHLVGWDNQAGLSRDLDLLADVLRRTDHEIHTDGLTPPRRHRRLWQRLRAGGPPWDLTIFVERANRQWMELSRRNVLIPNPEWLIEGPYLAQMNAFWCKSRSALAALEGMGVPLVHLGFSTRPRPQAAPGGAGQRRWDAALHVAGDNPDKGTAALVALWQRHPEWPRLTVVARGRRIVLPAGLPSNIQVIDRFIEDDVLAAMQREAGLHLCPSEVEGFGHTLAEGMSVGAVVVTTDAPPMNELVTAERGVLVPARRLESVRRGVRYQPDPEALEAALAQLLGTTESRLEELGRAAARWFEENDCGFRTRLQGVVSRILSAPPAAAPAR